MLSSDPRRTTDGSLPPVPEREDEPRVDPVDPSQANPSLTVMRGTGSSAERRKGTPPAPGPIPLPFPGELIDDFRLEAAIGAGGMGAVFRALDTKLDRHVALKLLPPDQASDGEVVRRFYQEGRSAAQLDHENIARVYSIGQDGYFHYIAFEYIEGATIRHRVEESGPLPVAEAVDFALQIAHALVHASQRGVVHRDIKPSNIIITPQGRAKLVDMGLARRFERGCDRGLTQSGMTLGTFDYISPEQARDPRDVDVRSDLYSLGCTLFHMLTGRPPFPGGTVLQKLIQHQEEPPADVRTMNPAVPPELAAVITKLMAKDRDRRYQSPEQLVRDLLGLAGAVGLDRAPRELEYWMAHGHRPTRERHLVWMLPALGFIVVITGLIWWGHEFSNPPLSAPRRAPATHHFQPEELKIAGGPEVVDSRPTPDGIGTEPKPVSAQPAYLRTIPVNSNQDLLARLASAPRRSVIVLADDGPYQLSGGRAWSGRAPAALTDADLTIKAEAGVRPLLKFAADARLPDQPLISLLHFVGGHVRIEGLEFELDAEVTDEALAAIQGEDVELTLQGCSFRRTDATESEGRDVAAVRIRMVRSRTGSGERPPAVVVDSCHFDGGQVAILAEGSADVLLRDCTMGPAIPSIWFDNARSSAPVPVDFRLWHSSILAGTGPVFRFDGCLARAWVDDSVIAPAGRLPATLVKVDEPRNLTWRGRSNVYSRIAAYLDPSGPDQQRSPITDFASWEQRGSEPREVGSLTSTTSVWDAADPLLALSQERENPTRVFLLSPRLRSASDLGAQKGPFGSNLKNVRLAQRSGSDITDPQDAPRRTGELAAARPARSTDTARVSPASPDGSPPPGSADPPDDTATVLAPMDPMNQPSTPPITTSANPSQAEPETTGPVVVAPPAAPMPPAREEPARGGTEKSGAGARPAVTGLSDEDVIRSSEQLLSMLKQLGRQGGLLKIAAGADLELPTVVIEGTGRYQFVAMPGAGRPRLRLRPPEMPPASPADWVVLLNLRSGSLFLQGLDLVIADREPRRVDRVAAASLLPGTELTISDCTLTVAVPRPSASVFVVPPLAEPEPSGPSDPAIVRGAVIQVRDSFLRSGGDGVTVAAGRELSLDLTNALVGTEGSLLHALGSIRRTASDPPAVKVRIDQVTARVKGGLIHLESTPEEPELTPVNIRAENSIVSTTAGDDPLFRIEGQRIEGQDQPDPLGDKIRWEARRVAYHRIKTYRRDEIVQTGILPRTYDRENWTSAFRPKDESPMLGDVRFLHEADAALAAWKLDRDELRLAPQSPAAQIGPDLNKIPSPPHDDDL
jgi:serine/threonine protein kinase